MQTTGEQNYWQGQGDEDTATETVASQYVGQELEEPDLERHEPEMKPIEWQASEYVHHEKNILWFLGLVVVTVALALLAVFVVKSWTFAALIFVMAAATMVYARRPPRVLNYSLSEHGLSIDDKLYPLHEFRAFSIIQEGAIYSIMLLPVKRFMPAVNVYFPPDDGEAIVDMFGMFMPVEQRELDWVERAVRKIRF